ncbi:anti-sigma factor [Herbiconiux solani]|uniref:anti-sigma factor n=1 Tax=Herbiconiux solani TaxID=661329 RepID=UPI000825C2E1|nr:anti-sigma factor [Herbiconiux solani]
MTHIDDEALALIALGDLTPDDGERAHLAACALCTEELAALTRTVGVGRAAEGIEFVAPPAEVWSRIRSELRLGDEDAAGEPAAPAVPAEPVAPAVPVDDSPGAAPVAGPAPVIDLDAERPRRRRPRPRFVILVAASALLFGLVAGAGIGVWVQTSRQADAGVVLAGADLSPFPDWPDARGSAVIEENSEGVRQLVVDVDAATSAGPSVDGLREVWLIRSDGTALVSVGYLEGSEGRFDVPEGIDLTQYSLVDISAETDDGDPGHSGNSIIRGELHPI